MIEQVLRWVRRSIKGENVTWQDIERFNPSWSLRIQSMAGAIVDSDRKVVDLGCGPMWLKEVLPPGIKYIGVDYKSRGPDTIVCDFNAFQFPEMDADVFFVSGCLEYVEDYEWFIERIATKGRKCIISYCCAGNTPEKKYRAKNAWVNHLSHENIVSIFNANEMTLRETWQVDSVNTCFVFEHA